MNNIIQLILVTFIPGLELRASIPYGITVLGMPWIKVVIITFITNILLGPIVYILLNQFVHIVIKINFFNKIYEKFVIRTRHKIENKVEKYGELGLALFIGVPLPGSGVYTGALAAFILGLNFKKFLIATVIGVFIAGILVTIATLTGVGIFEFMLNKNF
ncbi:MAG: small multi-drug export protein [Candidatus Marinimicrobia bacterium]|jgi:uncharacterized membrane protein|nr:small multi-drug export protein [Candidatus Neomarinimicrobiota bacterium]